MQQPDAKARRDVARRLDTRPEILYYLAEDSSPEVRRDIARIKTLQTERSHAVKA